MTVERRLTTLLLVLGMIAVPAAALRAFCVGNSCDAEGEGSDPVPFCSLDPRTRGSITAGFYEGRSPDVLGVTGPTAVMGRSTRFLEVPWPAAQPPPPSATRVPIVFLGPAFAPGELPGEPGLDQVAPTLEPLLGLERPFPEVRSGRAIAGATRAGARVPLAVIVVWKAVGSPDVQDARAPLWLLDEVSAGERESAGVEAGTAQPGSIPLDPTAILTTIGTGGIPSQHGITGTVLGTDEGISGAFRHGAPGTVIAALGDDLDEATDGEALVGLVAADQADRGLIGDSWYGGADDDVVVVERRAPQGQVARLLAEGWGSGGPPDLLGVTLVGSVEEMDAATQRIAREVRDAVPDAALVITATGSVTVDGDAIGEDELARQVEIALPGPAPVLLGSSAGGFFIDDAAAAAAGITTQEVADAMAAQVTDDVAAPVFDDTFPSFTVRFGRYC